MDWGRFKTIAGKWGKIVGKPVAGTVAGAAAGWAALNFWNPAGWLVAAIAVVALGVTTMVVGAVSEAVQESGKKDLAKARHKLREKLKKIIAGIYKNKVQKRLKKWSRAMIANAQKNVSESLAIIHQEIEDFLIVGGAFIDQLVAVRSEATVASTQAIMPILLPPDALAQIHIAGAVRRVGYRTKIAIRESNDAPVVLR